ncbi:vacuolar protein sorting-associated protein 72 homolog [Athalia rosae]|uniref:vacuolar protein sorting-associated protein 72 homolog n=1 Tax=Athalia rosae TaxID=37344 RepID=UPI00062689CE|nr:vacuolar protein sorting-associated protein 72 homolog [Athalia rosae]
MVRILYSEDCTIMASTREKRSNAGNRMARLLDEEEEDDFYKTTYGGFEETEQDNDYMEEDEGEDEVDSDFSIDENDEPVSDPEQDGPKKKRRLVTKAYKEPKPTAADSYSTPKEKKIKTPRQRRTSVDNLERKSIRRSTAAKSAATQRRLKERNEDLKKKVRTVKYDVWKPTQEELLEEALVTEELNLKSLEKYQKLENEKKNTRTVRKTNVGPTIRYQSLSMPVLMLAEMQTEGEEEKINVEAVDEKGATNASIDIGEAGLATISPSEKREMLDGQSIKTAIQEKPVEEKEGGSTGAPVLSEPEIMHDETGSCYERTFITFENDRLYSEAFKRTAPPRPPLKSLCAITRLPARYLDPVTQLPFRNMQTFRLLREAYYQQLESRADTSDAAQSPELVRWLEWRQKNRNGNNLRNTVRLEPASVTSAS